MANSSFLPEDYLEKRAERRTNVLSLTLFALVMAGVVGASLVTDRQRAEVRAQQAQVNAQFEEAAKRLEQLDELQSRKRQMIQKAKVTTVLLERVPRTLILSELINNMPADLSLLELNVATRVVPVKMTAATALEKAKLEGQKQAAEALAGVEVPPTEVNLQVVGLAPTDVQIAQFMTALGRCEMFGDLNLAFVEEVDVEGQAMRKFRVELKVDQGVDVQRLEPTMVKRDLKRNPMVAPTGQDGGLLISPMGGPAAQGVTAAE